MNSFKNIFLLIIASATLSMLVLNFDSVSALTHDFEDISFFNQDLEFGDNNSEVLKLQKFLNRDPQTNVSSSGAGSEGQETTYFGKLTEGAVIKFQDKYRSEILEPIGLSGGTGYFGPSTREKANEIISNNESSDTPNTSSDVGQEGLNDSSESGSSDNSEVESEDNVLSSLWDDSQSEDSSADDSNQELTSKIYNIDKNPVHQNTEVKIIAHGLKDDSQLYLSGYGKKVPVRDLDIINEGNATFVTPNIDGGKYDLIIENSGVTSDPFVVHLYKKLGLRKGSRTVDYNPPKISSVSNQPLMYGDTVTIKGANFIKDTKIVTPLGEYVVDPRDDSTIVLNLKKPDHLSDVDINEPYFEGHIFAENRNGKSDRYDVEVGSRSEGTMEDKIQKQRNSREASGMNRTSDGVFEETTNDLAKKGSGSLDRDAISSMTNSLKESFSAAEESDTSDDDSSAGTSDSGGGDSSGMGSAAGSAGTSALTDSASTMASDAASNPFTYGGNVMSTISCPCSANILMYIYDYKTQSVLPINYQPGVSVLLAGTPTGFYQVGSYSPMGMCLIPAPSGCASIPSYGIAGGGGMPGYGASPSL